MFGYEYQVRRVCRLLFREREISNALYHMVVEILPKNLHVYLPCFLLLSFVYWEGLLVGIITQAVS